jgi:hypothetical protein
MNLDTEFQTAFLDEPIHRPVEDRIVAGRRVVRRRRGLTGLAAFALIGAVGIGYNALDDSEPTTTGVAGTPDQKWPEGAREVYVDHDGELQVAPDVQVLESGTVIDHDGEPTFGVAYVYKGTTYWAIVDPSGGTYDEAFAAFPTLADWLNDQMALQAGEPLLQLVRFGTDGLLEPLEGVELLDQSADIDPRHNIAPPGVPVAVAEVRWEGQRWYVVARDLDDSGSEYFPAAASVTKPTLDAFVTWLEADAANFDGLR